MNKKFVWIFVSLCMVTLVAGAWAISIGGSTTAYVTGSPNTLISLTIPSINVNTTNGANSTLVYSDNFVISATTLFNVTINETFIDTSNGSCSGGESDCNLVYMIINSSSTYTQIIDEYSVYLNGSSQDKNISIEMTCVAYSCPQERTIDINLTEIV